MYKKLISLSKTCLFLLFASLLAIAPALPATAREDYQIVIQDEADLLTAEEENLLKQDMKPLSEFGHIAFVSVKTNALNSTKKLAEKYYREFFGDATGSLFLIDMQERYIYIFSDGDNYSIISKRRAEVITDNCYRLASKEQYYQCVNEAFSQMHELMLGRQIAQPMKYLSNALLALLLGLILNFIFVRRITQDQGTRNKQPILPIAIDFEKRPEISIRNRRQAVHHYSGTYADYSSSGSDSYSSSSSSRSSGSSSSSSSSSSSYSSRSGSSSSSSSSGSRHSGGGGGHRF